MAILPTQTLREAAAQHQRDEGLDRFDPAARWVWIRLGPIPFAYPSSKGRRRLLRAHDLHHLLTGYATDLVGEAEAAAWELGTGMRDPSAVRYAIRVFGFVLPFAPLRLRTAFVRGRRCRNLLGATLDDAMLSRTVADVRRELGLEGATVEASDESDRLEFRRWSRKGVAVVWGPLVPIAALAAWWMASR